MLDINDYSNYIVTLEPVINSSRVIVGYDIGLKNKDDVLGCDAILDYSEKLNLIIYMLDKLTYLIEGQAKRNSFSNTIFYITLESEYLNEPRVLIFVSVLKNLLENKKSSLVFTLQYSDFIDNSSHLYSYEYYYQQYSQIDIGVICTDTVNFHQLYYQLELQKNNNISVVKLSIDLRWFKDIITQVSPICKKKGTMIFFENVNDDGLFFEASNISNAMCKGRVAGGVMYLI
ncbi:hypothetical protein C9J01_24050 [Photobacterium rosenbergii]|uniref:EAL domain-containing protein n=1 Tax=Photobacterium rosenbergii TaxID=294936 RepID=A0A2T3N6E3_9GAMM|nr:hypothetical protein [Photobacterium rosenbergii]PSW08246.1 hypothetical protein C9J01_24050 [Photobacterium rosenbergii]